VGLLKEAAEITRGAAQGALDSVFEAGIPTVENLVEKVVDQLNHAVRKLRRFESFDEDSP
jgi:hypothetical protein